MIRAIQSDDIPGLNNLPPTDWNLDYELFLKEFLSNKFFHAFALIQEGNIIGTGNLFLKGKVAWFANIIIQKEHRGAGFGFLMTKFLLDFSRQKGCETQLLIATPLGLPVYQKLGFTKITEYQCFDSVQDVNYNPPSSIRPLEPSHYESVCQLDQFINGEDRTHLIVKYFSEGMGYFIAEKMLGFYLPNFGRGLVLSKDQTAGLALLQFKHSKKGRRTLLPVENQVGINFLEELGCSRGLNSSKMVLGKAIQWSPAMIYSYASGYCG